QDSLCIDLPISVNEPVSLPDDFRPRDVGMFGLKAAAYMVCRFADQRDCSLQGSPRSKIGEVNFGRRVRSDGKRLTCELQHVEEISRVPLVRLHKELAVSSGS